MVQIHSPRPLPKSCLSFAYAAFAISATMTFCIPMCIKSKPSPTRSARFLARTALNTAMRVPAYLRPVPGTEAFGLHRNR